MSLGLLFAIGCVVFVIAMTAVFLFGLTQFDAWQKRDEADGTPPAA
jgi:hypothetical protein